MNDKRAKRSAFHRGQPNLLVAQTETEAEILLYDEIGWWGITAKDFKRELDAVKAPNITLRINSPGGSVFDGLAIFNAVREHPATVTTRVDGLAASMASLIALAGDRVEIADNAFMMIHNPWSIAIGDANEMRKEADLLDKVASPVLAAYVEKTGQNEADIAALMDDETWFNADEALAIGLADEVLADKDEDEDAAEQVAALFDLSVFANVPDRLTEPSEHDPTVRELERALRDAGLSQIAAKQYIAAGRAAASQRDADEAEGRDVASEPEPPQSIRHPYR